MSKFTGDDRGNVTVEFTTEALERFIDTWNRAMPLDEAGKYEIRLTAEEYEPGKVTLLAYTQTRVPA